MKKQFVFAFLLLASATVFAQDAPEKPIKDGEKPVLKSEKDAPEVIVEPEIKIKTPPRKPKKGAHSPGEGKPIFDSELDTPEVVTEPIQKTRQQSREAILKASSLEVMNTSRNYVGLIPELSGQNGVRVLQVFPNSPAAEAGILEGDLIRELDGKIIRSVNIIAKTLHAKAEGQTVEWTVRREDVESIVTTTLTSNEDYEEGTKIQKVKKQPKEQKTAEPIFIILNAGFSVQKKDEHYEVVGMSQTGLAAKAGIYRMDLITHINDKKIKSKEEIVDVLNNAYEGSKYILTVIRDDEKEKISLIY